MKRFDDVSYSRLFYSINACSSSAKHFFVKIGKFRVLYFHEFVTASFETSRINTIRHDNWVYEGVILFM